MKRELGVTIKDSLEFLKIFEFRIDLSRFDAIWDTRSWNGQLEKTRSWKILSWKYQNENGKNEVGKLEPKLENF